MVARGLTKKGRDGPWAFRGAWGLSRDHGGDRQALRGPGQWGAHEATRLLQGDGRGRGRMGGGGSLHSV